MELMKSSSMNFQLRKTYLVALLGHTDGNWENCKKQVVILAKYLVTTVVCLSLLCECSAGNGFM